MPTQEAMDLENIITGMLNYEDLRTPSDTLQQFKQVKELIIKRIQKTKETTPTVPQLPPLNRASKYVALTSNY